MRGGDGVAWRCPQAWLVAGAPPVTGTHAGDLLHQEVPDGPAEALLRAAMRRVPQGIGLIAVAESLGVQPMLTRERPRILPARSSSTAAGRFSNEKVSVTMVLRSRRPSAVQLQKSSSWS